MPKRPTLADRKRAARETLGTQPNPPEPTPTPPAEPDPATRKPPGQEQHARQATRNMDTVSVCLNPDLYRLAKAAFLADWHAGGQADTFGDWIAGACLRHAHLTPQQRADHPAVQPSGQPRSFTIGAQARAAIDAAITADATAGYWTTRSAWVLTAITTAIQHARHCAGGTLPTPPDRLPGRLPARKRAPR